MIAETNTKYNPTPTKQNFYLLFLRYFLLIKVSSMDISIYLLV